MLKSQDAVLLMKLLANPGEQWSHRELAELTFISQGEITKSFNRLVVARLLRQSSGSSPSLVPILVAAKEFLIYGIKYTFPVKLGEYTPGIPTGFAAPVLSQQILAGEDPLPVWPFASGRIKGLAVEPLYHTVPKIITEHPDQALYDYLALVDAIRMGRARERNLAVQLLEKRLSYENK
jgi:hypothetical protein